MSLKNPILVFRFKFIYYYLVTLFSYLLSYCYFIFICLLIFFADFYPIIILYCYGVVL